MKIDIVRGETTAFAVPLEDALSLGFTSQEISTAVAGKRKAAVSAECRRRIYDVSSLETQMNMAVAAGVISGKPASDRTDVELSILVGAEAAVNWVTAMRATFAALTEDEQADFTSDAAWPDVPSEVLVMNQNF